MLQFLKIFARPLRGLSLLVSLLGLAACDQLGIETPVKAAERGANEAKAIGSACRHAMRAIEDCYTLNPKADKSAVFGGWREMDEYMRENKLEGVAPVVPRPPPDAPKGKKGKGAASKPAEAEGASDAVKGDADASAEENKPTPKVKSSH